MTAEEKKYGADGDETLRVTEQTASPRAKLRENELEAMRKPPIPKMLPEDWRWL